MPFNTGTAGVDVTPLRPSAPSHGGAQGTGGAGEPGELVLLCKESHLTDWQRNTPHTHHIQNTPHTPHTSHHIHAHIPHTPQTSHAHITYTAHLCMHAHTHTHIIESHPVGCLARSLLTFRLLPIRENTFLDLEGGTQLICGPIFLLLQILLGTGLRGDKLAQQGRRARTLPSPTAVQAFPSGSKQAPGEAPCRLLAEG